MKTQYSIEEMHTAMIITACIFEQIIDINVTHSKYAAKMELIGLAAMRELIINTLLQPIEAGWVAISNQYDNPFDRDFVPEFLARAEDYFDVNAPWALTEEQGEIIAREILHDLCPTKPTARLDIDSLSIASIEPESDTTSQLLVR